MSANRDFARAAAKAAEKITRDKLIARLVELNVKAAEIAEEVEDIKSKLRLLGPGEYVSNGLTLKITPPRSFNVKAAIALVPEELRVECFADASLDPAKVKRHLTPAQLEACMEVTNGKAKVTLA